LRELERIVKKPIKIMNYGTVMLELAEEKGLILHRDEIRKQGLALQRDLQREAAERLANIAKNVAVLIVDTHMFIKTREGYWSGLPNYVLNELKPDVLVLIEADPREIIERRTRDKTRIREKAFVDEVRAELALARAFASSCSVLTGAPVKIVMNRTGKQREAASEIAKVI
jgi:adenylate kinase